MHANKQLVKKPKDKVIAKVLFLFICVFHVYALLRSNNYSF